MRRRTKPFCLPLFLACLASLPSAARTEVLRLSPPPEAIDAVFARYDSRNTPGCSVAVIDGDEVVYKKSYGMADLALGVPMTSATSHWIPYSEARVFVALAVGMLARDGKIALDDPIRRHVPQVPAYAEAVTVRQLLHHASGLADYGVLAGPGFELPDRMSEDEFFRILARWGKLGFVPGQDRMYSNTDYALLKILVERSTGGSLHDYLAEKLLSPLGMGSTRIGSDQALVSPGHALFHQPVGDRYERVLGYRVSPVGGIAVTTSLDDLLRWERALRDPALGLGAMLEQLALGGKPDELAFGIHRRTYRGLPLVEYRGIGGYTYLVRVEGTALAVATLCNAYPAMWSFGPDVASLYAKPSESAAQAAPAAQASPAVVLSRAQLEKYVGAYRNEAGTVTVDVTVGDGTLVMQPRGIPAYPNLVPVADGRFEVVLDGSLFRVSLTEEDGVMVLSSWDVTADESGGETLRRWQPNPVDAAAIVAYAGTYVGDDVEIILHVRTDGDRLLMASRGMPESPLRAVGEADVFRLPSVYTARFERDERGRVVAVVLDANRVKGIRFGRRGDGP